MLERRNPGNPQVLFLLALTQFMTGKYEQAESNGLKVIGVGNTGRPRSPPAGYGLRRAERA